MRNRINGPRLVVLGTLAFLLVKIFFGVDFTDEGFYASIPYRFFLGDKPFVDETAIHQTAGFLTFPLVSIFVTATGSTTGLLLFLRVCFWILTAVTAITLFRYISRHASEHHAAIAAALYVVLTPEISTLSYNSMGVAFLTLALFSHTVFARGLSMGLATVAYPPLVLLAPFVATLALREPPVRSSQKLRFLVGFGLALIPFFVAVLSSGIPAILESYRESTAVSPKGGGLDKIISVTKHLWHNVVTTLIPAVAVAVICHWRKIKLAREIAVALFVAAMIWRFGTERIPDFVITLAFVLPFFAASWFWKLWPRPMFLRFLVSIAAGLIFAWASTNGGVNFFFGAIPAFILAVTHLPLQSFAAPMVAAFLAFASAKNLYRDDALWNLNSRVSAGPHAGLITSELKNSYVTSLIEASRALDGKVDRVVYMNDLPAGYLYSSLRPGSCTTWLFTPWNPAQRAFRVSYKNCIKKDHTIGVIYSKRDTRSISMTPVTPIEDEFDRWILNCNSGSLMDNDQFRALLCSPDPLR